jgi:hypothetical protein
VKALTDARFSTPSVDPVAPQWFSPASWLEFAARGGLTSRRVGINYAVQDAVVAANLLTAPLREGRAQLSDLAKVQQEREWPTKVIQAVQSTMQNRILRSVLSARTVPRIPWFVRAFFAIPLLRDIPARILAFGVRRVRVSEEGVRGFT